MGSTVSTFPTPYRVRVREMTATGQDDYGNATKAWSEADWMVSVISPGAMEEPGKENRDQSNIVWTIYGPKEGGYPRDEKAQIRLPGSDLWYEIDGHPRDFTSASAWTPMMTPPYVVELLRVEG